MFMFSNEKVRDHLDWKGNVSEWISCAFLREKRQRWTKIMK